MATSEMIRFQVSMLSTTNGFVCGIQFEVSSEKC